MNTYPLRRSLVAIAESFNSKTEDSRNRAEWIEQLWPATTYPQGYSERAPYCAAGMAFVLREWLKNKDVLSLLHLDPVKAEKWRCKSAAALGWLEWGKEKGLTILGKGSVLHTADIVIYRFPTGHHVDVYVDDATSDNKGPMWTFGFNTGSGDPREGDGAFLKVRDRKYILGVVRILD